MKLFSRILCPVDFDRDSDAALALALRLAQQNGASLALLNVAPLPIGAAEMSPVPLDPYPFWEKTCRARLEKIGREVVDGKVPYETLIASGDPATAILTTIGEINADLVVMGTHGRTGISRVLLGSVAEKVVREASVPVLTLHPTERRLPVETAER
jgi:universal stress protein A